MSVRAPFDVRDADNPLHWPVRSSEQWRMQVREYKVAAIREALDGVELGSYDERMIAWFAQWDEPTVGTLVSLLNRVRAAGAQR